jgi:hypothetical protein
MPAFSLLRSANQMLNHAVRRRGRPEPGTTKALDAVCCSVCARSSTDRASDYGSEGWGFESLRARQGHRPAARPAAGFFFGRVRVHIPSEGDAGRPEHLGPLAARSRRVLSAAAAWRPPEPLHRLGATAAGFRRAARGVPHAALTEAPPGAAISLPSRIDMTSIRC